MSTKRAIGCAILFALLAGLFAVMAVSKGALFAAIVFAGTIVLTALILVAIVLIVDGG